MLTSPPPRTRGPALAALLALLVALPVVAVAVAPDAARTRLVVAEAPTVRTPDRAEPVPGPVAEATAPASRLPVVVAHPPVAVAAPAPTTTTRPPADDIEAIIRHVWPDDLEERALRLAWKESSWRPDVRNFCCYGLFQIYFRVHREWLRGFGVEQAEDLYDPYLNTEIAYALYQRDGWGPWGG